MAAAHGRVHRRVLVDLHRAELHRHDPQDARPRDDLGAAAAVRLGDVRHQPDPDPRHAGARRHARPGRPGAALPCRDLRPGAGGRPDPVPAPVLVLLAPGRLHHDPAGVRGDQRDRPVLLAAAGLRLQDDGQRDDGDRRPGLPRLGPPHVRQRAVDVRRDGLLDPQLRRGDPLGDQGLQLDGDDVQGVGLAATRRCSTPWASSACSRSAA